MSFVLLMMLLLFVPLIVVDSYQLVDPPDPYLTDVLSIQRLSHGFVLDSVANDTIYCLANQDSSVYLFQFPQEDMEILWMLRKIPNLVLWDEKTKANLELKVGTCGIKVLDEGKRFERDIETERRDEKIAGVMITVLGILLVIFIIFCGVIQSMLNKT